MALELDDDDIYDLREKKRKLENKALGRSDPDDAIFCYGYSGASSSGFSHAQINVYESYVVVHQTSRRCSRDWCIGDDNEETTYHRTQRHALPAEVLAQIHSALEGLRGTSRRVETCDSSASLCSRDYAVYLGNDEEIRPILSLLDAIPSWTRRFEDIEDPQNIVTPEHEDYDFCGPADADDPDWSSDMAVRAMDERNAQEYGVETLFTEQAKSRIRGCLYGGAIGDAFGYPVEFSSLRLIRKDYGPAGHSLRHYLDRHFVVSDDTQMTLFTLEGICRGLKEGSDLFEEIRLSYVDWLATQKPFDVGWAPRGEIYHDTRLWHARAPGATCIRAIEAGAFGTPEQPINDSKGCGGVMRVAPLGLILRWSPEEAFDAAVRAAAMTHGHPLGYLSAGALAYLVRLLVAGYRTATAVPLMLSYLHQRPGTEAILSIVQKAFALSKDDQIPTAEAVASLGQGWVAEEALAVAIYAALRGSSFGDVLAIAANHDGDSDSTASIAGQIYGADFGDRFVIGFTSKNEWAKRLDVADLLEKLLDDFLKIR